MEDKYVIGEKEYTREELLAFGKQHYPKFYWIYRGICIGLMFIGVFMALLYLVIGASMDSSFEGSEVSAFYAITIPFFIMAVVGGIFFAVSFKKEPDEKYIKHAIDYYTKADANAKAREARLQRNHAKAERTEENKDITQLLKYKELLDAGIITQEEFDAKKEELLK